MVAVKLNVTYVTIIILNSGVLENKIWSLTTIIILHSFRDLKHLSSIAKKDSFNVWFLQFSLSNLKNLSFKLSSSYITFKRLDIFPEKLVKKKILTILNFTDRVSYFLLE